MKRRGFLGLLSALAAAPVALPLSKLAPKRWRLIGSTNGVTSVIMRPRSGVMLTPRMGSYSIGGERRYDNLPEMAKRHVTIVAHWPGWRTS